LADEELLAAELEPLIGQLERIAADRGLLASLADEERKRLLQAANQIAFPDRTARRQLQRQNRQRQADSHDRKRAADEQLLAQTGIRAQTSVRQLKGSSGNLVAEV